MKKFISILLAMLMAVSITCVSVNAETDDELDTEDVFEYELTYTQGHDTWTYVIKPDNTIEIRRFEGWSDPRVPEEINGKVVTSIAKLAFNTQDGVENVYIPKTVTSISKGALKQYYIWKVYVDEDNPVYSSRDGALYNKDGTVLLELPMWNMPICYTVPTGTLEIGSESFQYCVGVEEVTVCDGLKKVDDRAFYYCGNLEKIIIPESVTEIGKEVFVSNSKKFTICGYAGSVAESYATENGIKFEVLEKEAAEETTEETTATSEPVEETTEETMAVTDPVEETTEESSAVTESVEETTEETTAITESVEETTEETTAITEPVEETTEEITAVTEPVEETTEETTAVTDPVEETTEETTAATDPVEDPTEETTASTEIPATTPTEPATESAPTPTEPTTEVPATTPTEIITEAPTTEPTEPTTEAPATTPTEIITEVPTTAPTEPTTEAPANTPTRPASAKTSIALANTSAKLYVTGTIKIKATVKNPVGKTSYISSDNSVVSVDKNGKLVAKGKGKATITVMNNGVKKSFKVTVINPALKTTKKNIKKGHSFTIKVKGAIGKVKYISQNKSIAKVSKNGKITAKRKGSTVIKVIANGVTLKCKIYVK